MQAKWNGLGLSKLWLVILARCYLFLTKIRKIHAHIFRAIWWVFLTTHHLLFILNASLKFRANDSSLPKIKRPFNDKIVCNYYSELSFLHLSSRVFAPRPRPCPCIVRKILCVWRAPDGWSEYTTTQQTRAGRNIQHWQNRKVN